ncbi:hypothetical protein [Aliarcobacter cryaerophilus]|uniref:hypothetical protein n=1 Tax=Aliarcobacter cryaerophilus TaxID=28198 RepID=UPI0021B2CEE4|nr:hypothetical protein [Aliarcobacter cryaerophilus]MCT7513689.1 hypothetical protein [Aliarcobacter cryaerophilus]
MYKINIDISEIKKELSILRQTILNRIRNNVAHGINTIDTMIIDDIDLLEHLITFEGDRFNNTLDFLIKLKDSTKKLNTIVLYPKSAQILNGKKMQELILDIEELSYNIHNFINTSNISKDLISYIKKLIKNGNNINNTNTDKNNTFLMKQHLEEKIRILEKETEESKEETNKLKEKLALTSNTEEENKQLEAKIKILEDTTKKLEETAEELNQYKNETEKINLAINKLKEPAEELKNSKEKFEENRDNYNKYAMDLFTIAKWIFILIMLNLFLFVGINDIIKSEKNLTIGFYLINIFPIIFPTVLGFLFIRQSNINSQEVQNINKRFILIHEVNQSLQALVEVNRGKDMDNKTEKVIDKLIENILNYASDNNSSNNNSDMNFMELNESIDKLIDTIDKKIPLIKQD